MNDDKAPLYEKLLEHADRRSISFHVPGHKSGQGILPQALSHYGQIAKIDLTEITGLDDLHHPEEVIREAQLLAARCFGAEETFFLVNGSTTGNLAMILTVCGKDDILLVQRNVHKSVIHGLMLAGVRAVFIAPQMDKFTGLAGTLAAEDVAEALAAYPEAKGLLITNPNYYGMGARVGDLAELMHGHRKPLLVDEAHGAHYGFHPELPRSALMEGADIVVQSTHKMLTAMTMGAMLHVQGERVDRTVLARILGMLQSSSPSYPIMASLDLARKQMQTEGRNLLERALAHLREFVGLMRELPAFRIISQMEPSLAVASKDPFKVLAEDRTGTLNGFQLKDELEKRGCYCEMADPRYALLVFSPASTHLDAVKLYEAFSDVYADLRLDKKELMPETTNIYNLTPPMKVSAPVSFSMAMIRHMVAAKRLPFEQAVGFSSAEMIVPYPPGIPMLYPGERITVEIADELQILSDSGAKFQGLPPGMDGTIAVVTASFFSDQS
ncbi:aminotransferase class I/II-fold pyridoxal phosphate-dependent enzyme [Paenibacillus hamazuiensis]|uniref:aminotransferase class I/II-fold pyridoxal phosphate-dependent enzyme n=1 Tax=Paenibacillus hamazuiensis TaxID=2936508 RepID=UPI00200CD65A|nr:aminotransferase class I/II-fold pyridoxal phosphate-dependent enzyme [Paenibacillus hamazuiensis]